METMMDDLHASTYQKGETVFCESVGEYTLPDYLPEIRKLLRIETKILPTGQFVGNGKAEFTGMAVHTLLYSDENDKLASAVLNGDYRFAVPVPTENDAQVAAKSHVDRVSHRLSGPRRIGIRVGIASNISITCSECVPTVSTTVENSGFEELKGHNTVSDIFRVACDDLRYSDSYRFDAMSADMIRPISSDAAVFVKESRPQADGIYCAGELWVKFLYAIVEGQNELTDVLFRKIPFDTLIPFDVTLDHALVTGKCTALDVGVSDDGLGSSEVTFELQVALEGEGYVNRDIFYAKDMYAHGRECCMEKREISAFRWLSSLAQNFTVSGSSLQENAVAGTRAVDAYVSIGSLSLEKEDEKIYVIGECKAEAILLVPVLEEDTKRYERAEFHFPIRLEIDGKQFPEKTRYSYHVEFLSGQLRMDGEKLRIDGEVLLTLTALEEEKVSIVSKIEMDNENTENTRNSEIVVAYPHSGETLWSIAKRYKTDLSALAARNRIPERFISEPDAPSSIDGVTSLIIA